MTSTAIPLPLLCRAAVNGAYGRVQHYETGRIIEALFTYLDGHPDRASITALSEHYRAKPLVCLSHDWDAHIKLDHPNAVVVPRHMMKSSGHFKLDGDVSVPDGYYVRPFDEKAFELHPFSHGINYESFDSFRLVGAGAAVWYKERIVSSASSFLSFEGEVELDVSTDEKHRGKGLASACISLMLKECEEKGLIVHWDAQNDTSRHLAEKFGFEFEYSYPVYFLPRMQDSQQP